MIEVTRLLDQIQQGDSHAAEQLLPLVYFELRRLAAAMLADELPGQTLQPTALIHEAFLRLAGNDGTDRNWDNRGHFFSAAAEAMRRVLVENAQRTQRVKRGGTGSASCWRLQNRWPRLRPRISLRSTKY